MLIVAMLIPEKRLEMRLAHRKFRDKHVPNAEKNYPLSYNIQMGEEERSVRETTTVDIHKSCIKKIEGLEKASIFIEQILLDRNKIVKIEGLNQCKNLIKLVLWQNKISKIPKGAFDCLVNL